MKKVVEGLLCLKVEIRGPLSSKSQFVSYVIAPFPQLSQPKRRRRRRTKMAPSGKSSPFWKFNTGEEAYVTTERKKVVPYPGQD